MSYCLYLDDVRKPETDRDWVIVRSASEFKQIIEERGMPEHMSLDHDLGENKPSGLDCVNWMIENDLVPESFNVHSANPIGAENMRSKLQQWVEFNRGDDR
jgi:hypothetical protein